MAVGLRRDDTGGRSCVLVLGIIMVICACMWLMWNEREYANTYNMLVETQSECTPLPSSEIVNPILNEKLIYITGKLGTSGPVYDNQFNVSGDFVKLKRNVEMYQWIEEKEKGYHYKKDWRSEVMNSNLFYDPDDHHNPGFLPLTDMEWTADISTIGSYELSNDAVAKISNFRHLHLTPKENVYGDTVYAGDRLKPKVVIVMASNNTGISFIIFIVLL
ncbi:Transmembrane protein 43 [Geodia barretti]|uniref:Transmembrane protein 43 n=1 Tax=Geodia barretti TaxID=519541 RepID=A0AA35X0H2_GEOBA|nr:Transmembrane protein 43 [Geodia barretti]